MALRATKGDEDAGGRRRVFRRSSLHLQTERWFWRFSMCTSMETPERAYEAGTGPIGRKMPEAQRLVQTDGPLQAPWSLPPGRLSRPGLREERSHQGGHLPRSACGLPNHHRLGIKTGSDKAVARASRAALESFHRHE